MTPGPDLAAARRRAEAALAAAPDDVRALRFLGETSCRGGDMGGGAAYLRRALAVEPGHLQTRLMLAHALLAMGSYQEAAEVSATGTGSDELLRLNAYALQAAGRSAEAVAAYEALVGRVPGNAEAWNNLGNARAASGDRQGAVAALERAATLDPRSPAIRFNLGNALAAAGRHEHALAAFNEAGRLGPPNPQLFAAIGVASSALGRFDDAERAYREALRLRPDFVPAIVDLGLLFEHQNRASDLQALLADADRASAPAQEIAFVRALALRREGKRAEALELARAAPAPAEAHRKWQLVGELADRLGDADTAFAAFAEMNRLHAALEPWAEAAAQGFRADLARTAALVTPAWIASWSAARPAQDRPAPVFLVGFPRSGTTLLDTILMGHPDTVALEERSMLIEADALLGGVDRLPSLGEAELDQLRARYFEALDAIAPDAAGKRVIDKFPLHIVRVPLIQRIFPDARFIFAWRHPCDVVLSCFITNFSLNAGVANFLDLHDAAAAYDQVIGFWQQCREVFPLQVHDVRYEAMVEDLEGEVRPLLDWLGLGWDPKVLDHQQTAARRGYISTPSYAQVSEKLYTRAAGRWERYRTHMEPVLPRLAPWVERLGYPPLSPR